MSITIVGGGISGLSLAYFLLKRDPSLNVRILEAEDRPGGKILTERHNGYLCEGGVNGFLDNKPRTLELADSLSLRPLKSNDASRRRFVYSGGKLHLLPESLQAFLLSGLLSPCGKGRIFYEIVVPKGREDDETLASFAVRRLGREAYEKLIDPMASGIYAGNPERLSLKSCFPRIHELEHNYGSLIRALITLQRKAKKTGGTVGPGPGGVLTSFLEGMISIINALRGFLGDRLITSKEVKGVELNYGKYFLHTGEGETFDTETLALACPAYAASSIIKNLNRPLSDHLSAIPYPSVSVVCLGYRVEDVGKGLDGFGFLVPYSEKRRILGTLWDSSIFPDRTPEGFVLLRTMVGGARASELAMQDDESLIGIAMEELGDIMGIDAAPVFQRVYRHERAIPQYNKGHDGRLQAMDEIISKVKGLYITGNAYRGIGVNDCIENSFRLSERIYEDMLHK